MVINDRSVSSEYLKSLPSRDSLAMKSIVMSWEVCDIIARLKLALILKSELKKSDFQIRINIIELLLIEILIRTVLAYTANVAVSSFFLLHK